MSRLVTSVAALAACVLGSAESLAQARGPSAKQIQEEGQNIQSILDLSRQEWERDWGQETKASEREAMRRDSILAANTLAGMDAFLRQLPGRFRIEGKIEREVLFTEKIGDLQNHQESVVTTKPVPVASKISGVADCTAIGEGAGVNCLISATWPAFDRVPPPSYCRLGSQIPRCKLADPDYTAGEMLDTMRPAVLTLGLDTDPPQLRGMLVTSDTLTNEWAGKLDGNNARLLQTQVCTTLRCYTEFGINVEPGGKVVTFSLKQKLTWKVTVTLTLHRDPEAQLDKALRPMKAR
jgi:hypothetical protein